MKILLTILFAGVCLLLAFFGLGPVILADGSWSERLWTLLVVIVLFAVTAFLYWYTLRKLR
ncbi:DUF6954 family protein [Fictibacillus iocasae]|uniref:DUF6954 family protein n=1 Tax=Fictibacillus iocasae TaxID=2715437 RepID=A0ABW2NQR8_9BACL